MSEVEGPVFRPVWLDKLHGKVSVNEVKEDEVEKARLAMEDDSGLAKNGWTPEKLAAYFKERGGNDFRPSNKRKRPTRTRGKHNPFKWRR